MAEVAAAAAVLGFFGAVMALLAWQGARIRRRPRGANEAFVGPLQEIWHPAGHRARLEAETVEERAAHDASGEPPEHGGVELRPRVGRRGTSAAG
jgi:hypothetical protein